MGYTTDFEGAFLLDQPLTKEQTAYLLKFSETRRMKRDPKIAGTLADPVREAVGLPVGEWGEYFVGGAGFMGHEKDASVVDQNQPPPSQPSLWCHWAPTPDGRAIQWNGLEKFYSYVEWLEYWIERFLVPWGRVLHGEVGWQGEEEGDRGVIRVEDNRVRAEPEGLEDD